MTRPRSRSASPPELLSTLANRQRWRMIEELVRSDRKVQELTRALGEPANLVSYHLRKLREQSLVSARRSSADARDVYYSLDLARLRELYLASGHRIHPSLGENPARSGADVRRRRRIRVLFLCTHNSARSQMAEGILRKLGGDRFEVASAGTHPSRVHPLAIRAMKKLGIDIRRHRSKAVEELLDGPPFDYAITVCDAASEVCPVFPGAPERMHWSIEDPSTAAGTEDDRLAAFERRAEELMMRVRSLIAIADKG